MVPVVRLAPVPEPESQTGTRGQIRIVLADDHTAMRQSLRILLDGEADIDVIAETDSLQAMMRQLRACHPDVLVLDLGVSSSESGIETLSRLRRHPQEMRIVVLTMNDEPEFARRALQMGALGLVLKERSDSDLPPAVRQASRGRRFVSPPIAGKLSRISRREQDDL